MPPETPDGFPNICGSETLLGIEVDADVNAESMSPTRGSNFGAARSLFATALHMHQPLIPAGSGDPRSAKVISNLQFMFDHPEIPDAHNASAFLKCYKRMAEFIPELVREGKHPRVMLDYSGCLLHGLRQMGGEAIQALEPLVHDPAYSECVEWLGTAWGHAVAPSTPPADFRLHVKAWRRHFAALFGARALGRVRGFSPPEMALPNHPDVCHAFVRTLRECGYRWVMVQEHTVEMLDDGGPVRRPHVPHRLVARNSEGSIESIIAIVKTQGSDTKLVGQMQPYYEAKGLRRTELGGKSVPPIVTQIADGENGGVMMNEFPPMFMRVMRESTGEDSETRPANVGEYLAYLESLGIREEHLPAVRPTQQGRIWSRFGDGTGPVALQTLIRQLRIEDDRFHMDGGSWTNGISWTRGYENVLDPMEAASANFARTMAGQSPSDPRYLEALYYLLLSQTSCFRYWGQGTWADYGREFCRRAVEASGGSTSVA